MLTTLHYSSQLVANALACSSVTAVTVRLTDTAVLVRDDRDPGGALPASLVKVVPPVGLLRIMAASGGVARVQAIGEDVQEAATHPLGDHGVAVNWTPPVMPTSNKLMERLTDLAQLSTGKRIRIKNGDALTNVGAVQPPTLRGLLDSRLADSKLKPIALLDVETRNCQAVLAWTDRDAAFSVRSFVGVWPAVGGPHVVALQKLLINALLDRTKVSVLCGEVRCRDVLHGAVGFLRVRGDVDPRFDLEAKSATNRELETMVRTELETHIDRWLDKDKTIAKTIVDRAVALKGRDR